MTTGESVKTNVLILGSDAAGVTAAIEAAEAGADVIVLATEDRLGGAAAISGGGNCLVQTSLREESDTYVDTLRRYRGFIDKGMERDPDHGRPLGDRRMLDEPPFHALNFFPWPAGASAASRRTCNAGSWKGITNPY